MDRREFLKRSGLVAIPVAVGVMGLSPLASSSAEAAPTTLYVNFTDPVAGSGITVPIPFTGRFKRFEAVLPEEAGLVAMANGTQLVEGMAVAKGSLITVRVLECPKTTKTLEALLVMERS